MTRITVELNFEEVKVIRGALWKHSTNVEEEFKRPDIAKEIRKLEDKVQPIIDEMEQWYRSHHHGDDGPSPPAKLIFDSDEGEIQ